MAMAPLSIGDSTMFTRHSVKNSARLAVGAVALSVAVLVPATASAYTRGAPPSINSASCTGDVVTFTWDTSFGKPSKWEISDSSAAVLVSGRFTKAELVEGQKLVSVQCSYGMSLALQAGRSGSSAGISYP
ncbi:MAG: hypothetical protein RJB61_2354 [Actinomycetota bacterium]